MSDFQICRIKGGYRIHRKLRGEYVALCGAKPGKSRASRMRDRTGWAIYTERPVYGEQFQSLYCAACFKAPE